MDYYYHEFEELNHEFEHTMHDYPLFKEMIDEIIEKDIKEINELLEKNDEFYLKKAISKLKDLIEYIKDTSESIDKEYQKFDREVSKWEKKELFDVDEEELKRINDRVLKANELIQKHELKDIKRANKIMEELNKERQ